MGEAAAGEPLREAAVVEVAVLAQPLEGRLDLLRVVPPREQRLPHLGHGMVPAGEAAQRSLVRRGRGEGRGGAGHARYCSRSKDCMVRSISSAAMSDADWMPWILSLNSSGLLARRSASS